MSRVALVTGGAGGIGYAVCRRLAELGYSVTVADRDFAAAQTACADLPGNGHMPIAFDVSNEQAVQHAFDQIEAAHAISVLVTGAGILLLREGGARPLITDTSLDEWELTQAVNSRGTFLCIREYLRRRQQHPVSHGRVITFSSVAAQLGGYRSSSAYIASKAAVLGLTKAAAREAAPLGITVNCVAPGLIDAPMLHLSLAEGDKDKAAANIPIPRIGAPKDVAAAVAYLASEEASYVTGVTLDINGGYRMQ